MLEGLNSGPCYLNCLSCQPLRTSKLSQLKLLHWGLGWAPAQPPDPIPSRAGLFFPNLPRRLSGVSRSKTQTFPLVLARPMSSAEVPASWHLTSALWGCSLSRLLFWCHTWVQVISQGVVLCGSAPHPCKAASDALDFGSVIHSSVISDVPITIFWL